MSWPRACPRGVLYFCLAAMHHSRCPRCHCVTPAVILLRPDGGALWRPHLTECPDRFTCRGVLTESPDGVSRWVTDGLGWPRRNGGCECRGLFQVRGWILAGWITSLPATWSRGELDFCGSSLILPLFVLWRCWFLNGVILIIF